MIAISTKVKCGNSDRKPITKWIQMFLNKMSLEKPRKDNQFFRFEGFISLQQILQLINITTLLCQSLAKLWKNISWPPQVNLTRGRLVTSFCNLMWPHIGKYGLYNLTRATLETSDAHGLDEISLSTLLATHTILLTISYSPLLAISTSPRNLSLCMRKYNPLGI